MEPTFCATILENLRIAVFVIEDGHFVYANRASCEVFGTPVGDIVGRCFLDFVHPSQREMVAQRYQRRMAGLPEPNRYEVLLTSLDGVATLPVELDLQIVHTDEGREALVGTAVDISDHKRLLANLESHKDMIDSILEMLPDTFYRTDMDGVITTISGSSYNLLGYHPEELIGTRMADYYAQPQDRDMVVRALMEAKGAVTNVGAVMCHKDGHEVWISTNAHIKMSVDGRPLYVQGVARDETERKSMEDELRRLAEYDSLTGAHTRSAFLRGLALEFRRARQARQPLAVLYLDLDEFKTINDRYGHAEGDAMLQRFAGICAEQRRRHDLFGRLGGDEFALVLPGSDLADARRVAERVLEDTRHRCNREMPPGRGISVSIGIAELDRGDADPEQLLERADDAMYRAKEQGKDRIEVDD